MYATIAFWTCCCSSGSPPMIYGVEGPMMEPLPMYTALEARAM